MNEKNQISKIKKFIYFIKLKIYKIFFIICYLFIMINVIITYIILFVQIWFLGFFFRDLYLLSNLTMLITIFFLHVFWWYFIYHYLLSLMKFIYFIRLMIYRLLLRIFFPSLISIMLYCFLLIQQFLINFMLYPILEFYYFKIYIFIITSILIILLTVFFYKFWYIIFALDQKFYARANIEYQFLCKYGYKPQFDKRESIIYKFTKNLEMKEITQLIKQDLNNFIYSIKIYPATYGIFLLQIGILVFVFHDLYILSNLIVFVAIIFLHVFWWYFIYHYLLSLMKLIYFIRLIIYRLFFVIFFLHVMLIIFACFFLIQQFLINFILYPISELDYFNIYIFIIIFILEILLILFLCKFCYMIFDWTHKLYIRANIEYQFLYEHGYKPQFDKHGFSIYKFTKNLKMKEITKLIKQDLNNFVYSIKIYPITYGIFLLQIIILAFAFHNLYILSNLIAFIAIIFLHIFWWYFIYHYLLLLMKFIYFIRFIIYRIFFVVFFLHVLLIISACFFLIQQSLLNFMLYLILELGYLKIYVFIITFTIGILSTLFLFEFCYIIFNWIHKLYIRANIEYQFLCKYWYKPQFDKYGFILDEPTNEFSNKFK